MNTLTSHGVLTLHPLCTRLFGEKPQRGCSVLRIPGLLVEGFISGHATADCSSLTTIASFPLSFLS